MILYPKYKFNERELKNIIETHCDRCLEWSDRMGCMEGGYDNLPVKDCDKFWGIP